MRGAQAYGAMMQRIPRGRYGQMVGRWARDKVHPHMSPYGLFGLSASSLHEKSLAGKQQQSQSVW